MSVRRLSPVALMAVCAVLAGTPAAAGPIIFSATGADTAAVQGEFDAFAAAIGGINNGVAIGSQPDGFRRITWDGGGAAAPATVFASPMTAFSSRGNVYTTGGTGFEISGAPTAEFGDINAAYPDSFTTFSTPRLFAALGSNIMDVLFTVPGTTNVPAFSRGFGVVFTDVDLADTTTIELFNQHDRSIGVFDAEPLGNGLSFLGVLFGRAKVSRVRIVSGNSAFGPADGPGVDVVAMDDFIFGEPKDAAAVPEPAALTLLGSGLALAIARRRKRAHSR